MFEHLGHTTEVNSKKDVRDFKVYLSLLFFAILIFIVSWTANQGPISSAYGNKSLDIDVSVNYINQRVVADMPRVSVFDFFIKTENENVKIDRLKINTNGLYDLETLAKLKLFHNDVQLGEISQIDETGNIYFDINGYQLDKGNNQFQLILNPAQDVEVGNIFRFSLVDNLSIILEYENQTYSARADWPIESGTTSFVDQGSLVAYNNLTKKEFITLSQSSSRIASFNLASQSEVVDLQQIIIDYTSSIDLSDHDFVLISDNQIVANAQINNSQIIFDLDKLLVVGINKKISFDILTAGLPNGSYNFDLASVLATGSNSGQNLFLTSVVDLSTVHTINNYLEIDNFEANNDLSAGWNILSAITLQDQDDSDLSLHKLTWLIEGIGADVNQIEVLVDDKSYQTGINFIDDKISIYWDDPLLINKAGVDIKLLVFVDNLKDSARLQGHLLTDNFFVDQENIFASNIVWSLSDDYYNSHLLPSLPLLPNILTN